MPTGNLSVIVPGKTKWSFQNGSGSAFRGRLPGPTRCMRQATGWWVLSSVTVTVNKPSPAAWATPAGDRSGRGEPEGDPAQQDAQAVVRRRPA